MGCGCGQRAKRLLLRLGFTWISPRFVFSTPLGVLTLFEPAIRAHHLRLTILGVLARILLSGKSTQSLHERGR